MKMREDAVLISTPYRFLDWTMNTAYTGTKEIWGRAVYPNSVLWDPDGQF
jgi:hypothetical protein